MVFCPACQCDVEQDYENACCVVCGMVLEADKYTSDVTFAKGADGEGEVVGQFVSETGQARGLSRIYGGKVYGVAGEPHEVAEARGRTEISSIVDHFTIRPREHAIEGAHRLYKVALSHGFTRGRRASHVAGSCLYIFCREEQKPFMLIDFSDFLQVNVYALGAVYLQLLKLLHLEDHPTFTKPIDPSLYVHRFADRLNLGRKMHMVATKTLRLITSMKRDWMQTGRRPAGICGAALYIACHVHGFTRTKFDIIQVIHIGWDTLDKRLREFADTQAAELTADEFEEHAKDFESEIDSIIAEKEKTAGDLATVDHLEGFCEHIMSQDNPAPHFDSGMCKACYVDFLKLAGGSVGTTKDPPAFTKGLRKEHKKRKAEAELLALPASTGAEEETAETLREMEAVLSQEMRQELTKALGVDEPMEAAAAINQAKAGPVDSGRQSSEAAPASPRLPAAKRRRDAHVTFAEPPGAQTPSAPEAGSQGAPVVQAAPASGSAAGPSSSQQPAAEIEMDPETGALVTVGGEAEAIVFEPLDDLDDDELGMYMLNDEEAALKSATWEHMNADWIEKQALKAMEDANATDKPKKKRKYTKSKTVMRWNTNGEPVAETSEEATKLMLETKKLSDKVDYNIIGRLFDAEDDHPVMQDAVKESLPMARKHAITTALTAKEQDRKTGVNNAADKWSRALEADNRRRSSFLQSFPTEDKPTGRVAPSRLGSLRR